MFPHDVAVTGHRPDGFLISRQTKICIILELTVPLEENIKSRHVKKTEKYNTEIVEICEPGDS